MPVRYLEPRRDGESLESFLARQDEHEQQIADDEEALRALRQIRHAQQDAQRARRVRRWR